MRTITTVGLLLMLFAAAPPPADARGHAVAACTAYMPARHIAAADWPPTSGTATTPTPRRPPTRRTACSTPD